MKCSDVIYSKTKYAQTNLKQCRANFKEASKVNLVLVVNAASDLDHGSRQSICGIAQFDIPCLQKEFYCTELEEAQGKTKYTYVRTFRIK